MGWEEAGRGQWGSRDGAQGPAGCPGISQGAWGTFHALSCLRVLGGLVVRDQGASVHAQACACLYVWGADVAVACTHL